jgi:hypothetical protein
LCFAQPLHFRKSLNSLHFAVVAILNSGIWPNSQFGTERITRIYNTHLALPQLDNVFLEYLLSISDTKDTDFLRSYGGHRSALTFLFKECRISPTEEFRNTLKSYMSASFSADMSRCNRICLVCHSPNTKRSETFALFVSTRIAAMSLARP